MTAPDNSKMNRLLAALPAEKWARWLQQLEYVTMPLGDVLYESRDTLSHVYLPTTAVVSLRDVMESGAPAEIAVVGNESIVWVALFMGGESTSGSDRRSRLSPDFAGHQGRVQPRSGAAY